MVRFSTLDSDDVATWTPLVLLDSNGEAIASTNSAPIHWITIVNNSASDRIFRVSGSAPFPVKANGGAITVDLEANNITQHKTSVETDTATLTSLVAFGG